MAGALSICKIRPSIENETEGVGGGTGEKRRVGEAAEQITRLILIA